MDGSDQRKSRPKARQSIAHLPSSTRINKTDKQNATMDLSAAHKQQDLSAQSTQKRTRGKSLGPGGLEALKEIDGNATKIGPLVQPRSILKPTVPLTPPKSIPTFDELRQKSTKRKSPLKNATEALLIDFSTPAMNRDAVSDAVAAASQNTLDPFSPIKAGDSTKVGQHDNTATTDEEDRARQEQKRLVMEQRAARRKSMANRRVSFAPEATLHTWSVMEMPDDSTTSSTSNSTRRQSLIAAQETPQQAAETAHLEAIVPVSSQHHDQLLIEASPAQEAKMRRTSNESDEVDESGDEMYSSSPSGEIAAESSPIRVEESIGSDSDTDGDTAMSMDEMTQTTVRSEVSGSSTHSSLDDRLRQAATQAGTRGIEYDEYGDDMSMEIVNDTITNAFQPWSDAREVQAHLQIHPATTQDDSEVFSPATKAHNIRKLVEQDEEDDTAGMTMEMTRAMGSILASNVQQQTPQWKPTASRRRSSVGRRQSMGVNSSYGDESMDLTTVAGGILTAIEQGDDGENVQSDEQVTMEFTTAVGSIHDPINRDRSHSLGDEENLTMDMTTAFGGILAPIEEQTEPQTDYEDENTMAMDMTRAVGIILPFGNKETASTDTAPDEDAASVHDRTQAARSLHLKEEVLQNTPKQLTSIASESGSPALTLKVRSSGRTRSARANKVSSPHSSAKNTPQKTPSFYKHTTPTKQLTPLPLKSKSPQRTPLSANITHRGASPKKLFQAEIKAKASPASVEKTTMKQRDPLFEQDDATGRQTPRVVLHAPKPHQHLRRRSSGIGIDKEGFGSPSVTQLLARRSSIGEVAPQFKLEGTQPRLRFEDPKQIAKTMDAERAEDELRESGRFVMEQEANGQQEENATIQLKDMIESLSPKKPKNSKFKGRKSLAVGSARGLLGKRPMELDDEDEDCEGTPKRLKNVANETSPVKRIHLPKPPSKEETTGRLTTVQQNALNAMKAGQLTPALDQSPMPLDTCKSPHQLNRFKEVTTSSHDERPTSFETKLDNVIGAVDSSIGHPLSKEDIHEEKISLQLFLNMTNIHFIELNTTKRRHTVAQTKSNETLDDGEQMSSTKANFVAAATTLPLLELYQHATRELKSYISTGRKIIRSIETETFAEQPALFREYVEARPDVKLVMDNQFRNGKTNARLQSKQGWYVWRSQLVDGLRGGLEGIRNDMQNDIAIVAGQTGELSSMIPVLEGRHKILKDEVALLQNRVKDFHAIDHQALKASRKDLTIVDQELHAKLATLATIQDQMLEKSEALGQAAELKEEMQGQIEEANRVRNEHSGWNAKEVFVLQNNAARFREETGWSLISAEEDLDEPTDFGVALTLSYANTLHLFFYPSAYGQPINNSQRRSGRYSQPNPSATAPISLSYCPSNENGIYLSELPTEHRFFLQFVRSQLHAFSMMPKGSIIPKTLLDTVSSGWLLASNVSEEIRLLSTAGITKVSIQGDETLCIKLMLIFEDKSRVDVAFNSTATISEDGKVSLSTVVTSTAIYGSITSLLNTSKNRKVQSALNKELENKPLGTGSWVLAVHCFEEWHAGQVQKQQVSETVTKSDILAPAIDPIPLGSTTPKSPVPVASKTPSMRRSPLATKKSSIVQKKIPVPISKQEKLRTSQREQQPQPQLEKVQSLAQNTLNKDKENMDPFSYGSGLIKAPAITPEMQEAMMQRTPIKRLGALRRSPI